MICCLLRFVVVVVVFVVFGVRSLSMFAFVCCCLPIVVAGWLLCSVCCSWCLMMNVDRG